MVETNWDYLFYSYKANLPLSNGYRKDLDRLHKAVNIIVESELKEKQKQGAKEELEDFKHVIWIPDITIKEIREHLDKRVEESEANKK